MTDTTKYPAKNKRKLSSSRHTHTLYNSGSLPHSSACVLLLQCIRHSDVKYYAM